MQRKEYLVNAGIIVAVCTSTKEGVPKYPQPSASITPFGLFGDFHCRAMRRSFSQPGTSKLNTDRHVTIVGEEAIVAVNQKLGLQLGPGDLGENILTRGMGDLSDIIGHSVIRIGNDIVLKVVKQNQPCSNLVPYHPLFVREIKGRRGLLCAVISGVSKEIKPNDMIGCFPPVCRECGYWMLQSGGCWKCHNCSYTLGCE